MMYYIQLIWKQMNKKISKELFKIVSMIIDVSNIYEKTS